MVEGLAEGAKIKDEWITLRDAVDIMGLDYNSICSHLRGSAGYEPFSTYTTKGIVIFVLKSEVIAWAVHELKDPHSKTAQLIKQNGTFMKTPQEPRAVMVQTAISTSEPAQKEATYAPEPTRITKLLDDIKTEAKASRNALNHLAFYGGSPIATEGCRSAEKIIFWINQYVNNYNPTPVGQSKAPITAASQEDLWNVDRKIGLMDKRITKRDKQAELAMLGLSADIQALNEKLDKVIYFINADAPEKDAEK